MFCTSGKTEGINRKDELYNKPVEKFKAEKFSFRRMNLSKGILSRFYFSEKVDTKGENSPLSNTNYPVAPETLKMIKSSESSRGHAYLCTTQNDRAVVECIECWKPVLYIFVIN